MKLWTKEGIDASEKGMAVVKDWVRKNRHHSTIKMTPVQIMDMVTIIEQGFDDIKFYLPRFELMQRTLQDIHDKLKNGASHEFEETIEYCKTTALKALKESEQN